MFTEFFTKIATLFLGDKLFNKDTNILVMIGIALDNLFGLNK